MIKILILILGLLSFIVGGNRTVKSMVTSVLNMIIFAALIQLIYMGANIPLVTIISILLISFVSIFYQNDVNIKTKTAFLSIVIVVFISFFLILLLVRFGHLQGFSTIGDAKIHVSNGYDGNIGINMYLIEVAVYLLVLLGGLIDTSVAISSGIFELSQHNNSIAMSSLFESGMNIGKKILNSNVNTLFFIFAGESMIMCINYLKFYSISTLFNGKDFAQDFISIIISALGTVIIIPITSVIGANWIKRSLENKFRK